MSEFHFRVRAKDADSGEGSTRRPVGARMRYGGGNLHRLGLTGHLFGPTAPDLRRSRMGFGGFWRSSQQEVADQFDRFLER